jgi:DNA-directed RNA polymerase subunit F
LDLRGLGLYWGDHHRRVFIARRAIKVAEAAKVIENTQRDLNIALMNELRDDLREASAFARSDVLGRRRRPSGTS